MESTQQATQTANAPPRMKWQKRVLKHPRTQALLAWLFSLYIRLVFITSRKTRYVDEASERYMRGDDNAVFAFWHGRMMLLPAFCPPGRKMHVLISLHRDGVLISRVISHFGQATISGSTSKRGMGALIEIVRALKGGDNVSITPDGPRGPVQVVAQGTAAIAKLTGKPVLPVTFSSTRCVRFKSWDRFMLALPFGHIAFLVGAPVVLSRDASEEQEEECRLAIEQAMNRLVEKADEITHA
jgi:lysophospholipid acyltransferase (LPLAT)-like uncharacterized protein